LGACGLATLLLDLLTRDEELDRRLVFDIPLLAQRLITATRWAQADAQTVGLPIGYFGAGTGAGAALWAAAELGDPRSGLARRPTGPRGESAPPSQRTGAPDRGRQRRGRA
jgi:putative phosphoribosyl transferase